ncbi:hypothetical protein [Noviherbaspirillum suwonense]|uniref:Uncharacterized protein n=1 Tax=Noviherbaspirillum suwonense TaxID=1224511 RepID=A0ABY1PYB1_9BURK|nr:hypothetical protein [Noviherbaspirillum suwonense]SMP51841.1 hypothetical protein SAMN06295970_10363 [Noviherbaspirillum suwonense]
MFSSLFLTSYCFFTAAVTAYQRTPEDVRGVPDVKTVADAFGRATAGLSKDEQTALLLFVLRLIQQPEEFNQNKSHRDKIESTLDREIAKQFPEIVNDKRIIVESEFLARAGFTKEDLSQKLRERRIFSIPEWVHKDPGEKYYAAFFVDPQYDRLSLEAVSMALRASPDERKYRFFTTPVPAFADKTPLEVLASGELECVVEAAKAFRRQTVRKVGQI